MMVRFMVNSTHSLGSSGMNNAKSSMSYCILNWNCLDPSPAVNEMASIVLTQTQVKETSLHSLGTTMLLIHLKDVALNPSRWHPTQ